MNSTRCYSIAVAGGPPSVKCTICTTRVWLPSGLTTRWSSTISTLESWSTEVCPVLRDRDFSGLTHWAATFKRLNANYPFPQPKQKPNTIDPCKSAKSRRLNACRRGVKDTGNILGSASTVPTLDVAGKGKVEKRELEENDLLVASPVVYGFSLADKIWREFSFGYPLREFSKRPVQSNSTSRRFPISSGTTKRSRTLCFPPDESNYSSPLWRPTTRTLDLMISSKERAKVSSSTSSVLLDVERPCPQRPRPNTSANPCTWLELVTWALRPRKSIKPWSVLLILLHRGRRLS